jgi:hypothetical protein
MGHRSDNVLDDRSDFLVDKSILGLRIKHLQSDENLVDVERHTVECLLYVSHLGNLETHVGNTVSAFQC